MEKKISFILFAMFIVFSLSLVSCNDDNDDDETSPSGNNGSQSGYVLQNGVTYNIGYDGAEVEVRLNDNTLYAVDFNNGADKHVNDITSVGKVSGLSSITQIPGSGWNKSVKVNNGHGYVIRCHRIMHYGGNDYGYTYVRLYIKEIITDTSGGILGVRTIWDALKL